MKIGSKSQILSLVFGLMGSLILSLPTPAWAVAKATDYSGDRSAESMICGDRNGDGTVDQTELAIFAADCAVNSDGFDIDVFVDRVRKGQVGNLCSCDGYALTE